MCVLKKNLVWKIVVLLYLNKFYNKDIPVRKNSYHIETSQLTYIKINLILWYGFLLTGIFECPTVILHFNNFIKQKENVFSCIPADI